jgi:plasmid stabilization system protein ParE
MTSYSLLITPEAAADIKRINQYLLDNWSERVRDNFIRKLRKMLASIQLLPHSYPVSHVKPALQNVSSLLMFQFIIRLKVKP